MSPEELQKQIEELKTQNTNLTAQVKQNAQAFDSMLAQLDAHKGTLNEALNTGLQLRTNWIMAQKQNQQLNTNIQTMQKTIDGLNKQLEDATKRITDLEAPKPVPNPE